jgi:predicted Zn-dependent protease
VKQKNYLADDTISSKDISISAEELKQEYQRLNELIKEQFRSSRKLILFSGGIFFGIYAAMSFLFRAPLNEGLIKQLELSSQQLEQVSRILIPGNQPPGSASSKALEAIAIQSGLSRQALQEIREAQLQIRPEGVSMLQLLGGSAVLGLVGFLGLQRLQNIDGEIQQLQNYMLAQLKIQLDEGKNALGAIVHQQVEHQLDDKQKEIEGITQQAENFIIRFAESSEAAGTRIEGVENRINAVLEAYKWLQPEKLSEEGGKYLYIASAGAAHNAAVEFERTGNLNMTRLALQKIVEQKLPGTADNYHNSHVVANQALADPILALEILEIGLSSFQDSYDLMADKAKILIALGKAKEAVQLLEDLRQRKPNEFARGWRPATFYADAVKACELTEEVVQDVRNVFEEVTQRLSFEPRLWQNYAAFEQESGFLEKAEEVFRRGIERNPLSQVLNYSLGDLLLKLGRPEKALTFLEKAQSVDYLEDYQHDTTGQYVIQATLAQAYGALNKLDQAERLYQAVVGEAKASYTLRQYAEDRLRAITYQKQLSEISEDQ